MSRVQAWSLLIGALLLSAAAALLPGPAPATPTPAGAGPQRIVSASPVADAWLCELIEPERVVAVSAWFAAAHPWAARLRPQATIASLDRVEALRALGGDLVVVADSGDPRRVERLRAAGLAVADLGPGGTAEAAWAQLRRLGAAVGAATRAEQLIRQHALRLRQAAADVPMAARPPGLAVEAVAGALTVYGAGTTHHAILLAGGVRDAAPGRWRGWVRIDAETLRQAGPRVLLTSVGGAGRLATIPGMDRTVQIIELPEALLSGGGPLLAEAAERLRLELHP